MNPNLSSLEEENPGIKTQMLAALKNVRPGHLLDRQLIENLSRFGGEQTP